MKKIIDVKSMFFGFFLAMSAMLFMGHEGNRFEGGIATLKEHTNNDIYHKLSLLELDTSVRTEIFIEKELREIKSIVWENNYLIQKIKEGLNID